MKFNHFYQKNKVAFWLAPIILILFFFLRLYNLTIIPVFVDEAIYIRWSQVMRAEQTLRFLPLSDGKQPLFMWLTIPFFKIFSDPLVAGRMVSILGGLGNLAGISTLTFLLFKDVRAAWFSAFLYAIAPFTVFFDRMALVDSLLACFGIWTFIFGILLVIYQRLDLAMIAGMVLGGALLTKSPAMFFATLLPAGIILVIGYISRIKLIKLIALWIVVYFFAYGIYNILRLGPNFHMIALRNRDYVFPLSQLWQNPWDPFQFHLKEIFFWFANLLTWPILLLSVFGILIGLRGYRREVILLLVWLVPPLLAQAEYAKVFTPRYILFSVPLVLVFGGWGCLGLLENLGKKKLLKAVVWGVLFAFPLWFDFALLTQPQKTPLPRKMRSGYLEEWTSGYGIKEVADYLKKEAKKGKVLAGTEGFFGTLPEGLQIYLEKVPNITVIGIGYPINRIPEKLINALVDNRVFLVVNDSRLELTEPELQRMKLIAVYPKAVKPDGRQEKLLLYEILKP